MDYILVTGAYGGMGQATVRELRARGFGVFALDRRVPDAAVSDAGVVSIEADVTDEQSIRRAVARVREVTDRLYAIVHFAGVYMLDSLVEMDSANFERIFRINVFGAFLVNKAFLPLLSRGGRIVMTTSELAPLDPLPFTGIYAVTKSALDKYAYSLRMELQLLGIYVSVLRAGAVKTDMLGASTDALGRFCERTQLYSCNAERFRRIVDSVEAKCVSPEAIAARMARIVTARSPRFAYSINRNPLLRMMNALPQRTQLWAIRQVLKTDGGESNADKK